MSKKSFILFSCILTGFGTQEAHAYQNPEETRGRCTYIDTARQYLENAKNLIDNELYNKTRKNPSMPSSAQKESTKACKTGASR